MDAVQRAVRGRGPRWAVIGTGTAGQKIVVKYVFTRDQAENAERRLLADGHWVQVYPPDPDVDLRRLGRRRAAAMDRLNEATAVLQAAVLLALEKPGATETGVAQEAGVNRHTVRTWAGKQGWNR